MWVWEAGLPSNAKPPTTNHYIIRLVGMGITSTISVSGRIPVGWGGCWGSVYPSSERAGDGSPLAPGPYPWNCPSLGTQGWESQN